MKDQKGNHTGAQQPEVAISETKDARKSFDDKDQDASPYGPGLMWGAIAGVAMGVFLGMLGLGGFSESIPISFGKYLILLPIVAIALTMFRNKISSHRYFKKGITLSAILCATAGVITPIIYSIFFASNSVPPSGDYDTKVDTVGSTILIMGMTFFEIFALGMICSFIILQLTKQSSKPA